jgi:hypothetical protein
MGYQCCTCGLWHDERPTCFISEVPAAVAELSDIDQRRRVERSSDQCILDGEHFFILANLDVPIQGSLEHLRWTVWSTLSESNFERASELWDTVGRESEPPYFGWLSNQIPGYPASVNIKAMVHTGPVGIRPQLLVIEEGHPLASDQDQGVSEERAEELIHAALQREAD